MNRYKVFPTLLCYLLAFMAGALLGGYPGRAAGEGQMLAGGAIVLGYMLMGGLLCLSGVGYLCWQWKAANLWKMAGALLLVSIGVGLHSRYVIEQRRSARESRYPPAAKTERLDTTVAIRQLPSDTVARVERNADPLLEGLGLVQVPFSRTGLRLHFYADTDYFSDPVDSLIYVSEGNRSVLRYAPPYLLPFYQKEDYEALYFRFTGVQDDRVKIVLNAASARQGWVNRHDVKVLFWPDFLASVFAIYPLDGERNPVRRHPLVNADRETNVGTDEILLPERVEGDWIYVKAHIEGDSGEGYGGWVRWRDGDRLLVGWDYRL